MHINNNKYLTYFLVCAMVLVLVFAGIVFSYILSDQNEQKNISTEVLAAKTGLSPQSATSAAALNAQQDQNKSYPDYIWVKDSNNKAFYPYVLFTFKWKQENSPTNASINLSCLGHYQLLVNGQTVYRGPNFAALPEIYYDQIDIKNKIKKGENQIQIICNYINFPIHEYPNYPFLALLVGGKISDGNVTHFLADQDRWFSVGLTDMQNGAQISNVTGYSEIVSLPLDVNSLNSVVIADLRDYEPKKNPLPLLSFIPQSLIKLPHGVYDLGSFMVGYLEIKSSSPNKCEATVTWGGRLDINSKVLPYFNQQDKIIFPPGVLTWGQFSRRAGRYIQIDAPNCLNNLTLSFQRSVMPFSQPVFTSLPSEVDHKIYKMSVNTLLNNVQNHIEDSVEREKAMYIGDSLAVSACLLQGVGNERLVKEMIKQFAKSQNEDGKIPSMTPSGVWQFIPGYHLQWIVWLDLYLSKTKDTQFAKEMQPIVQKALDWDFLHESAEGFIFNKNNEDWWNFIDWTSIDNSYKYSTALQAWYFKSLTSAANTFSLAGINNEKLKNKAASLKLNLQKMAFDEKNKIFADSFDDSNKSSGGLVTNALVGRFDLFSSPGRHNEAINYFSSDLTTITPYSQAWVIEWLIDTDHKDQALSTLRKYWGAMLNEGTTSIFESYSLTLPPKSSDGYRLIPNTTITSSLSHGWGCGPIYLYPKIFR